MNCAFWRQVDKSGGPDACWPWRGNRNQDGYGNVSDYIAGKRVSAHRHAYRLHHRTDPGPLSVLHRCDNPSCVNPTHLFIGTQKDNMMDAFLKGRPIVCAPGAANYSAKLTDKAVTEIRESQKRNVELARRFGVSPSAIRAARTGTTWRHVRLDLPAEKF